MKRIKFNQFFTRAIAAAMLLSAPLYLESCIAFEMIKPSGEIVLHERDAGEFTKVSVSSGFELVLTQSDVKELSIETYENIHDYIITEISGDQLRIRRREGVSFSGNPKVKIYLSANHIERISSSGGGKINLNSGWEADELKVTLSGGGKLYGTINVNSLDINMSGGSESELSGFAAHFVLSSSGGSRHRHFDLQTERGEVALSGGARAELNVSDTLEINASGGSDIRYIGDPKVATKLSGGSRAGKFN